ncbi:MAG TPA: hypothetical protein VE934_15630 [Polaromonas sp.]|uniref:hypothetical protein n=1 Tax=Polaromonas sp. TaxID=1869339 RepID=UPI002D3C9D43|nr:hypothetical protein [Polaromonas sp.]HYW58387.1 hypothetical protein [Polaromonas sp.]
MHMMNLRVATVPRLGAAVVWLLVLASGWYWAQAVMSGASRTGSSAIPAVLPPNITSPSDLARLLGASPPVLDASTRPAVERLTLAGVIADGRGQGAALISVDGKPARAFPVGAEIAPGSVLVAVGPKEALVADDLQSPVRTVLQLSAQVSPAVRSTPALALSNPAAVPVPAASAAAPPEAVPAGPPPRADSRRQQPTSLRREDKRGP